MLLPIAYFYFYIFFYDIAIHLFINIYKNIPYYSSAYHYHPTHNKNVIYKIFYHTPRKLH